MNTENIVECPECYCNLTCVPNNNITEDLGYLYCDFCLKFATFRDTVSGWVCIYLVSDKGLYVCGQELNKILLGFALYKDPITIKQFIKIFTSKETFFSEIPTPLKTFENLSLGEARRIANNLLPFI